MSFTPDEPWTLFEMPDLAVVVAGLSSTMAESHRDADHYGWVGQHQLCWFADRLAGYRPGSGLVAIGEVTDEDLQRPLVARQAERLATDPIYPAWLYVPQRYRLLDDDPDATARDDLLRQVITWRSSPPGWPTR